MNPIRVYNRFLDLQIETDSYQSLQYERNYHGVGTFELHINRYMHGADSFQKGNIIAMNKQENKAGIILSREIELDESGKESENFKLTGLTMDSIMNRRVSVPPGDTAYDRKSGDAETVMKHYVYNHFINPTDKSRKLDILEIAPNQNRGEHVKWESRFKNIGEELEKISIESGLGWGIFVDFNTKKLVFDCFQAKNLVQNNEFGYSPVFFSPEFETIKSQSFIDSDQDYKNVGYVGGQGEGVERKIIELGNVAGWDRIEAFVDARDVGTEDEEDEEELTEEEIEEMLIDRGKKKMAEMETVFSLEAEILTPITRKAYEYTHEGYLHPAQPKGHYVAKQQQITPFQYEKDFDLGDRVQVVNKSWGLTMTAPIVSLLEIHEPGGFRLEGTFGQTRPTLITKIKDKFDELEGIEKQEAPASVVVGKMKEALKYTDDKLTEEERKRIEQAMENLEKSMKHTEDYTYDKDAIDEKDKEVSDTAKKHAEDKAKAAQEAAEAVADAKAKLAEENAIANADGKITSEEKKRIEQAEENLSAAKADAKAKADAAERAANAYSESEDKKVKDEAAKDAKEKADQAEKNANDFSKDASNIMEGIIDVGAVPIRSGYSGARIEWDGTNGLVQYDKNGIAVNWFDLEGRLIATEGHFSGDISGATGTFSGSVEASQLKVNNPNIEKEGSVGLILEVSQWQEDTEKPFEKTGYIYFRTTNNGLELYRVDLDGNEQTLDHTEFNTRVSAFNGKIIVGRAGVGGSDYGVEFPKNHSISSSPNEGDFTFYGNRANGKKPFKVRSHKDEVGNTYRDDFWIDSEKGTLYTPHTYDNTTTYSANLRVGTTAGHITRMTSSRKDKLVIEPTKVDYHKIMDLQPSDWFDKADSEKYASYMDDKCKGKEADCGDVGRLKRVPGLIAEDVEEAGLGLFVEYSEDGEVAGVQYDRLWILLIPMIKEIFEKNIKQQEKLDKQEKTINEQQKTLDKQEVIINDLVKRIEKLENAS